MTHARADFVGPYTLTNFKLANGGGGFDPAENPTANGTVASLDGVRSIVLTGSNDGSGLPGFTELTVVTPAAGTLHFKYSFTSVDLPGADTCGYILNGSSFPLASISGQSGVLDVVVRGGDTFGFRVDTGDNTGEPGVLVISDFGPVPPKNVPTVSFAAETAIAIFLATLSLRLRRKVCE